jgi:hypothetical protein
MMRALFVAAGFLAGGAVDFARAQSTIVTRFEVRETVVSHEVPPDGDLKSDSTRVRYTLSAPATTVSLIVFEADSITPVDTLRAPASEIAATRDFYWKGRRWDGSPAPEGPYVVTLYARGTSNTDSLKSLPLFVDLTPPTVQVLSALPNPYAPGAPTSTTSVSFSFTVGDASPVYQGRIPDELRYEFFNPGGTAIVPVALTTTPSFTGASGNYVLAWDANQETTALADGEFHLTLTVTDVAGYTAKSTYYFDVDTRAPDVKATSLATGASVGTVPDSLRGYAFDKRGVDSLLVRYADNRPYQPIATTWVANDTLNFAVPLADSFSTEGAYQLDFHAVDNFGRATDYPFSFRYDTTAPPAPTLDPFRGANGTWNTNVYPLSGTAEDGGDIAAFVRVYRNGALLDSVSTFSSDDFEVDVPLEPGRNDVYAVLRDGAHNTSPPSNTLSINFETGAGFFAPAPFGPGDLFDVNANGTASGCTLRLFDLTGHLVIALEDDDTQQFYSFSWNGLNGSGVEVKKGPLVGVAAVDYPDGSHDVFREIFLYDPNAP